MIDMEAEQVPFFTRSNGITELLINRKVLFAAAVNTAFPFTVAVAFCASELCEDDEEINIAAGVT